MSLRVASLDYLGTVAARLRRDAVSTQQTEIDDILESVSYFVFILSRLDQEYDQVRNGLSRNGLRYSEGILY